MTPTINEGYLKLCFSSINDREDFYHELDSRAGILRNHHDPKCILLSSTPLVDLCANELPKLAYFGGKK